MIKFLIDLLTDRLPCRIIDTDGEPYLERYYLFTFLDVRFYIHKFVGSDSNREIHDHPWRWARSIVLLGYYFEDTRFETRIVRWYNKIHGDTFHRVELPVVGGKPTPCYTLFFHKASGQKEWGFLEDIETPEGRKSIYTPFHTRYPSCPKPGKWWLTVPKGREVKRV